MATIREHAFEWASMDDVRATFTQLIQTSSSACDWIKKNKTRNSETLVAFNFLACSVTYLEIVRNSLPAPVQVLALCTRSAYELYLIARKVLSDKDEIARWLDETASDNLVMMAAFVEFLNAAKPLPADFRQAVDGFKDLCASAGLETAKKVTRVPTASLAKEFGLDKEHTALFSLYSKLVHPSAFLVNCGQQNPSEQMGKTLLFALLDYADRMLNLVASFVGAPEVVTKW
jgi:hypothetical protein